jgi:hypothetical protein
LTHCQVFLGFQFCFTAGNKKHPNNQFSYAKSAEYHRKLRADIDKLFDEETKEKNQTPRWVHDVIKESSHSGESPLFANKHLSPIKVGEHVANTENQNLHFWAAYRGLARDVIHDVIDGRRHVGGIFFASRGTF